MAAAKELWALPGASWYNSGCGFGSSRIGRCRDITAKAGSRSTSACSWGKIPLNYSLISKMVLQIVLFWRQDWLHVRQVVFCLSLSLKPFQDFERDDDRSASGGSDSDGEENIGWSTVNLDEEKQQQDVRAVLQDDQNPLAAKLCLAFSFPNLLAWLGRRFCFAGRKKLHSEHALSLSLSLVPSSQHLPPPFWMRNPLSTGVLQLPLCCVKTKVKGNNSFPPQTMTICCQEGQYVRPSLS